MERCTRSSSLSINQPNDERCRTFNVTSAVFTASKDIDIGKLKKKPLLCPMDSINTNIVVDLVSVHAGKVEVTNNFEAALDVISAFCIFRVQGHSSF